MSTETKDLDFADDTSTIVSSDAVLRTTASWAAMIGTALFTASFFAFLMYHSFQPTTSSGSWLIAIIEKQFAATVAIPLSAISSVCVILLLKATTGPIEFEGLGFKFRGASGPIVLWVLCFLAMVLGVHLLWK